MRSTRYGRPNMDLIIVARYTYAIRPIAISARTHDGQPNTGRSNYRLQRPTTLFSVLVEIGVHEMELIWKPLEDDTVYVTYKGYMAVIYHAFGTFHLTIHKSGAPDHTYMRGSFMSLMTAKDAAIDFIARETA